MEIIYNYWSTLPHSLTPYAGLTQFITLQRLGDTALLHHLLGPSIENEVLIVFVIMINVSNLTIGKLNSFF